MSSSVSRFRSQDLLLSTYFIDLWLNLLSPSRRNKYIPLDFGSETSSNFAVLLESYSSEYSSSSSVRFLQFNHRFPTTIARRGEAENIHWKYYSQIIEVGWDLHCRRMGFYWLGRLYFWQDEEWYLHSNDALCTFYVLCYFILFYLWYRKI